MKNIVSWLVIGVLVLVNVQAYFHSGIPYTHDGENHLARFANYKIAVREGQLPPRFAPNLMNRYGYPVFNYNYPLANMLSLPLSLIKVPYDATFKLLVAGFLVVGLLAVKRLGSVYRTSAAGTWLAMVVYGLAPFLLSAILYRGNIGEIMAYGLLPWLLWLVHRWQRQMTSRELVAWALVVTAFLLCHNVSVLIGVPVIVLYALLQFGKDAAAWKRLVLSFGLGGLLSLWFWLPAMLEKSLVILDEAGLSVGFADHFPTLSQLLWSPQTFGFSYLGSVDSLSFNLGLLAIITWITTGIMLLKTLVLERRLSATQLKVGGVWLLAALAVGFQLALTQPAWEVLPLLRFVQLPWRLTLLWAVLVPILVLQVYRDWPRWLKVGLWLLVVVSVLGATRLRPVDYRYLSIVDLDAFSQSTTTLNENLPKNFTYTEIADWQPTARILRGSGEVQIEYWKGSDRLYQLNLTEDSVIVEPTMLFAGWQTRVTTPDGQMMQPEYVDDETVQGRLAYQLPAGEYQVRSRFTQWTWPRVVGNSVSLLGAGAVVAWLVSKRYDTI